jgi:hypothetical protein
MQLPRHLTEEALKKSLVPGSVLIFEVEFPDKARALKRLIVVSNDNETLVLMLTTTSNLFLNRNYRKDDIYLKAGQEVAFEKETLVQMNRIIEEPVHKMQEIYSQGKMKISKPVSAGLLNKIYAVIEKSELIEQKYIQRILKHRQG